MGHCRRSPFVRVGAVGLRCCFRFNVLCSIVPDATGQRRVVLARLSRRGGIFFFGSLGSCVTPGYTLDPK